MRDDGMRAMVVANERVADGVVPVAPGQRKLYENCRYCPH